MKPARVRAMVRWAVLMYFGLLGGALLVRFWMQ
jgi:hypothetical protein